MRELIKDLGPAIVIIVFGGLFIICTLGGGL